MSRRDQSKIEWEETKEEKNENDKNTTAACDMCSVVHAIRLVDMEQESHTGRCVTGVGHGNGRQGRGVRSGWAWLDGYWTGLDWGASTCHFARRENASVLPIRNGGSNSFGCVVQWALEIRQSNEILLHWPRLSLEESPPKMAKRSHPRKEFHVRESC